MMTNTKISQVVFWISVAIVFIGFMENIDALRYDLMVPLIGLGWILHFFYNGNKIDTQSTKSFIYISLLIVLIALPSVLKIFPHAHNLMRYTFYSFAVGMIVKVFSAYSVFAFLKGDINKLEKMIKYVIILNLSMFFLQFIVVFPTGYYIDPLRAITGEHSRYGGGMVIPVIGQVYRCTGFFEEPSTYSGFMVVLLASKLYLNPKVDRVVLAVAASIILSFSVAAIIYGLVIIGYFLLKSKASYLKYILFLLSPLFAAAIIAIALQRLTSLGGDAQDIRSNLNAMVFAQQLPILIFGNGALGIMPAAAEVMNNSGNVFKLGIASLNDNGMWLFFIIKFGFVGLAMIMSYLFFKSKSLLNRIMLLVIFLTKLSFLYFGFIFYFFLVFNNKPVLEEDANEAESEVE
ncbi:hypothetical protein C0W35_03220 [Photobacterium kishitanii]|uniref:hypothetical protein n=1 Tax=Photobacterium kishitanii TaxID=318456 RepID=UPI0004324255|nr:hypothetical protein [Photobacterium kishitanii]OBU22883.1 hypothetical protein AYY22_07915 [Photobacterium kishitanii]PSU91370.1 hypothetical protein C0W42_04670 [Photobacterium kishitanii]PSU97411.1 hypothetical protein C0W35_03220 [Photobacterium kishitanii]CEO40021.1 conserved membrane hypothetical protein [Photobacterium kishitanii]